MSLIATALAIGNVIGLGDLIGNWLGGDNGNGIAQKIVTTAEKITNKSLPEDILKALDNGQSEASALVYEQILANRTEYERMAFVDKRDARYMQLQTLDKQGWFAKNFLYLYASFWAIFSAAYFIGVTFFQLPTGNLRFADLILGFIMGTVIGGIISFFYGASLKQSRQPNIPK